MSTQSASRNITGYLRGLSSPSVTLSSATLRCSPTANSAGQTRLPTFSTQSRSSEAGSRRWRSSFKPPLTIAASRWQARPVVIGTGPCGLFAGLLLAQMGFCPLILERGKAVRERTQDTWRLWRGSVLDPESNVQFGEGGAGTFSDGKLYTQIRDREHRIPWILRELVKAGAPEDILIKSRPHIGTDRLIKVVRHVREEIIALGGRAVARSSEKFGDKTLDMERFLDVTDTAALLVLRDGRVV